MSRAARFDGTPCNALVPPPLRLIKNITNIYSLVPINRGAIINGGGGRHFGAKFKKKNVTLRGVIGV